MKKKHLLKVWNHKDSKAEIDYFIKEWNETIEYDYEYRQKFNIPFLSEQHLNTRYYAIRAWGREQVYIHEATKPDTEKRKNDIFKAIDKVKQNNT